MSEQRDITIRVVTEGDGGMWATVEQMPGVFAAGQTLHELRASLEEGIALYLAEEGRPVPAVHLSLAENVVVAEAHAHLALA